MGEAAAALLREVESGKEGILRVRDNLSQIDCSSAKASVKKDEMYVKGLIQQSVGFAAVDTGIKEFLAEWVAAQVRSYLTDLVLDNETTRGPGVDRRRSFLARLTRTYRA